MINSQRDEICLTSYVVFEYELLHEYANFCEHWKKSDRKRATSNEQKLLYFEPIISHK